MQNEERLTPAERELEAALGALRPAAAGIDRDCLMYRAGERAGGRRQRLWQGATAMFAAALMTSLLIRPAPRYVDRYVYVEAGAPARVADARPVHEPGPADDGVQGLLMQDATGYVRLREAVLVRGIDALPVAPGGSATVGEPLPRVERILNAVPPSQTPWNLLGVERLLAPGEHL
jgi:hypothetical protein